MTNLLKVIEKRRAYRGISETPIEEDVLDRLITAATYAPSCANKQPWRFVAVRSGSAREKVQSALAGGNYWALKAPLYVLAATKPDLDCQLQDRRDYALFDLGQAVMSLEYQAVHEGLIVHPIAGFKDVKLKEEFGIPDDYILVTIIVVAYPGDDVSLNEKHRELEHAPRSRKPRQEVVSYDEWAFSD